MNDDKFISANESEKQNIYGISITLSVLNEDKFISFNERQSENIPDLSVVLNFKLW